MRKITFLIRSLNSGGAERQLITLVKALNKSDFNITILTFYSGGSLEGDLKGSGVNLISLGKVGRWDVFGFWWRLVTYIRQIQPDVLHGYLTTANILTVMLKPLFPKTKMIWGVRASNMDLTRYDWLSGLTFKLECWLSRFADLIIANSHTGKAYHVEHGFPGGKMVVISNGIDTERFQPDLEARKRFRSEWEISEDTILIGLVGRLDPMKDHPTFLRAAALLLKERNDLQFICVGGGSEKYAEELYQLVDELGISDNVIWTGARTDMLAVYNGLELASSSSYGEGFPNVIGEAMACGVPCVVTDVGDSAWIVGDLGVVVPPKSPEALADGFELILQIDRKMLGIKSRFRILEDFNVNQLVNNLESELIKLDRAEGSIPDFIQHS